MKVAELDRRHLGEYTAEQEADDFSLEWGAAVGLASDMLIELHTATLTDLFRAEPDSFALDGIEWPACMDLYRRRFRDPGGRTHFVPLGDLHDPHHGACYRMFNLVRAGEAHHFATSDFSLPAVDWSTLRHDAEVAAAELQNPTGAGDAGTGDAGAVPARQRALAAGAPRIVDRW